MGHYPIIVYWCGKISHKGVDMVYNGGLSAVMFIHRQHTTFELFLSKVYDVIGCDHNSYELKMEMKFPMTGKNVLIPVANDESISALDYAASQALGTVMEVYVEMVANLDNAREVITSMELPESGPSVRHETFIDMLTNPNYVNEHIDEFSSPAHLGSINANEVDSLDQEDEHIDSDPEEDDEKREALDATIRMVLHLKTGFESMRLIKDGLMHG